MHHERLVSQIMVVNNEMRRDVCAFVVLAAFLCGYFRVSLRLFLVKINETLYTSLPGNVLLEVRIVRFETIPCFE